MWPDPDTNQENAILRIPLTHGGNAAFHNFPNEFSHILDPHQRRRLALSEIDKIPFGWYHVRAITVAGTGFFADSYDWFAINLAVQMLGISFWEMDGGVMLIICETAIKTATLGGAILGQIIFGWLADVVGRKKMYGIELIILLVATLGQSLSSPSSAVTITGLLIFGRVVIELGIGGDHPMSAVITSEGFAILTIIFSVIGFGHNFLSKPAFLALYIIAQFFFNFGPNTTTSIVPGECFPTRYRSTGHGLSAAGEKLGATIAQVIAQPLLGKGAPANCTGSACSPWLNHLMEIFACSMLCGTLVSILIPETKRQTLEAFADEAQSGAREGSNETAGGQAGLISTLAKFLRLHSSAKNEIEMGHKKQHKKSGKSGSSQNEDNQYKNHGSSTPTSSKCNQFQVHRLNWNAETTYISKRQYGVEQILLQDVGNLLG